MKKRVATSKQETYSLHMVEYLKPHQRTQINMLINFKF